MKSSDLFVAALENEGVDRIFGIPGEENLDVVESIRKSSIKLVLTRHEQAAAFMAATYGRLTGTAWGLHHDAGSGCAESLHGRGIRVARRNADDHDNRARKGILSSRQAKFQIVDMVAAMKPLTKLSRQIVSPMMIPTLVREAFRVAQEERPGPVHLELPEDIAAVQCEAIGLIPPHPVELPARQCGRARSCSANDHAERNGLLIMFGAAASRPRSTADLAQFVIRTRIPYFTTQMGKGTVPGGTELYMGTAALSERDYVHEAIERADLVIAIGHDTIEKPPFIMGADGPNVIHVGYLPATVEQVYFPQAEVIGDLGPSLGLLADRLEGKIPNAQALLPLREGILARLAARATENRFTPQRLVHDIREVMPPDGILALDNGMYKIWFARNYGLVSPTHFCSITRLATMGAGLPSAIMAAMLYPETARHGGLRRWRIHDE